MQFRNRSSIFPGFGLSLGFSVLYVSLLVLLPFSALALKASDMSADQLWLVVASPRALASYKLSLGTALAGASINVVFGLVVAWVLVRYPFPGRTLVDAVVDLPFAMPTAVSGIALTALYSQNGWLGGPLEQAGLKVAFTPLGITVALTFIGLPFVVRTVQPVLEAQERDMEEAAVTLGATRWQTFRAVILPPLYPALLTGFTLAFARGLGEFGSVVFISGNMPFKTEITPLLIMTRLEQFDYLGAAALAMVLLGLSFTLLLVVNVLQWRADRQLKLL